MSNSYKSIGCGVGERSEGVGVKVNHEFLLPYPAGEHARAFLGDWKGALICNDFSGYEQSFTLGVTEVGCMAHSRRKFFDLHASNKSQFSGQALSYVSELYDVEREVKRLSTEQPLQIRQAWSRPLVDAFNQWMVLRRHKITDGADRRPSFSLDFCLPKDIFGLA